MSETHPEPGEIFDLELGLEGEAEEQPTDEPDEPTVGPEEG